MAAPQQAPLAPFYSLTSGQTIVLTALDATTGALVGGVQISNVSLGVDDDSTGTPLPPPSPITGAYTPG